MQITQGYDNISQDGYEQEDGTATVFIVYIRVTVVIRRISSVNAFKNALKKKID